MHGSGITVNIIDSVEAELVKSLSVEAGDAEIVCHSGRMSNTLCPAINTFYQSQQYIESIHRFSESGKLKNHRLSGSRVDENIIDLVKAGLMKK